jgi:hypothetical protein
MPVVIKVVDYNPDDPEWSREMCEREEETCKAVNGSAWAPELLWASHTESCSWFVFEALTPDPMVSHCAAVVHLYGSLCDSHPVQDCCPLQRQLQLVCV